MDSGTRDIITNFANGVGGSSWWGVNNVYGGIGYLPLKSIVTDTSYSYGTNLTFQTTWDYIQSLIDKHSLPADYNGIYMLVTSR
jgi:hypothetical protein